METIYKVGSKCFTNLKDAEQYEKTLEAKQKEKEKRDLEQQKMQKEIQDKRVELNKLENEYRKKFNVSIEMPILDSYLRDIFNI